MASTVSIIKHKKTSNGTTTPYTINDPKAVKSIVFEGTTYTPENGTVKLNSSFDETLKKHGSVLFKYANCNNNASDDEIKLNEIEPSEYPNTFFILKNENTENADENFVKQTLYFCDGENLIRLTTPTFKFEEGDIKFNEYFENSSYATQRRSKLDVIERYLSYNGDGSVHNTIISEGKDNSTEPIEGKNLFNFSSLPDKYYIYDSLTHGGGYSYLFFVKEEDENKKYAYFHTLITKKENGSHVHYYSNECMKVSIDDTKELNRLARKMFKEKVGD